MYRHYINNFSTKWTYINTTEELIAFQLLSCIRNETVLTVSGAIYSHCTCVYGTEVRPTHTENGPVTTAETCPDIQDKIWNCTHPPHPLRPKNRCKFT